MSKRKSRNSIRLRRWIPSSSKSSITKKKGKNKTRAKIKNKIKLRLNNKVSLDKNDKSKPKIILYKNEIEFELYNLLTQHLNIPINYDKFFELLNLYKNFSRKERQRIQLKTIKIIGDTTLKMNKLENLLSKNSKTQIFEGNIDHLNFVEHEQRVLKLKSPKIINNRMNIFACAKVLNMSKNKILSFLIEEGHDVSTLKLTSKFNDEMATSLNKLLCNQKT